MIRRRRSYFAAGTKPPRTKRCSVGLCIPVRVSSSYRTHTSVGYAYEFLAKLTGVRVVHGCCTKLTKVSSRVYMRYPYPYPHRGISTRVYSYPGYFSMGKQSAQQFRVRMWKSYETHSSVHYPILVHYPTEGGAEKKKLQSMP